MPHRLFIPLIFLVLGTVQGSAQQSSILKEGGFARVNRDQRWYVGVIRYSQPSKRAAGNAARDSCPELDLHSIGYPFSMLLDPTDSLEVWAPTSSTVVAPSANTGHWVPVSASDRRTMLCCDPRRLTCA